jgi:RimJ/RimL family protein N-acetyltransferase
MSELDRQAPLADAIVRLVPLGTDDFERLYAVASDPLIWAQHPNPDRWQRDVFRNFFDGAIQSGGAYLIVDRATDSPIGSTRFYGFDPDKREVHVGYTFFARSHWGGKFNPAVKRLMLDHAFASSVERVLFHIGVNNKRSRIAIERLGASFMGEIEVAYHGEAVKRNAIYAITRDTWAARSVTRD